MRKIVLGVVAAVLLLAGGWYFASPSMALAGMRDAARDNNAEELAEYVDFPAFRESLKAEMMAMLTAEMAKDNSGMAAFGMALGGAMVNNMIDAMVTPAGLSRLMAGATPGPGAKEPAEDGKDPEYSIERDGLSRFKAVFPDKNGKAAKLVFVRHGIGWKLSGIELPASPASADTAS